MTLTVLELYPHHLAVNGDMGNNIVLEKRMRLAGVPVERVEYEPGADLPERADIVTIGSGPDSALRAIADDVARIAPTLRAWSADGVPMLAVTAGMHLFGTEIRFSAGDRIAGASVFDISVAPRGSRALTHSFLVDTDDDRLIGVENHGVVVTGDALPLGRVVNGVGNDGRGADGARINNATGTHLHGPILAMNPALADRMIEVAAERAGIDYSRTADHERIDAVARTTRSHLAKAIGASESLPDLSSAARPAR